MGVLGTPTPCVCLSVCLARGGLQGKGGGRQPPPDDPFMGLWGMGRGARLKEQLFGVGELDSTVKLG